MQETNENQKCPECGCNTIDWGMVHVAESMNGDCYATEHPFGRCVKCGYSQEGEYCDEFITEEYKESQAEEYEAKMDAEQAKMAYGSD